MVLGVCHQGRFIIADDECHAFLSVRWLRLKLSANFFSKFWTEPSMFTLDPELVFGEMGFLPKWISDPN